MSNWILLADGSEYFFDGPERAHNRLDIATLAHHLAIINRFTGATTRPYSVAEHSLLCADIADQQGCSKAVQLACLMHDVHEAVTGDASSPVKRTLGSPWHAFESPHANAVRRHFGLQSTFAAHHRAIHAVDLVALATERRDLTPYNPHQHRPWPVLDTPGRLVIALGHNLKTARRQQAHWTEWRDQFIERYQALAIACQHRLGQLMEHNTEAVQP